MMAVYAIVGVAQLVLESFITKKYFDFKDSFDPYEYNAVYDEKITLVILPFIAVGLGYFAILGCILGVSCKRSIAGWRIASLAITASLVFSIIDRNVIKKGVQNSNIRQHFDYQTESPDTKMGENLTVTFLCANYSVCLEAVAEQCVWTSSMLTNAICEGIILGLMIIAFIIWVCCYDMKIDPNEKDSESEENEPDPEKNKQPNKKSESSSNSGSDSGNQNILVSFM